MVGCFLAFLQQFPVLHRNSGTFPLNHLCSSTTIPAKLWHKMPFNLREFTLAIQWSAVHSLSIAKGLEGHVPQVVNIRRPALYLPGYLFESSVYYC